MSPPDDKADKYPFEGQGYSKEVEEFLRKVAEDTSTETRMLTPYEIKMLRQQLEEARAIIREHYSKQNQEG